MSQDALAHPNPSSRLEVRNLIQGSWVDGEVLELHYPYDGRIVATVHVADDLQVDAAVRSSRSAWYRWRRLPAHERSAVVGRIAIAMQASAADLASVITWSTGKPIRDSRSEVERAAYTMVVSAEEGKRIGGEVIPMETLPAGVGKFGMAIREPLGVIAGISPFNAPLGVLCHKLGPALAAGDTFVLKPHPHGAPIAGRLAQLAIEAGLPPGVFNIVNGEAATGKALVAHPEVSLVSFTGSGRIGEEIIKQAGLKRTIMELGGNAPTIVHEDADLEYAVQECVPAAFALSGQSCVSTQRIYVHEGVYQRFVDEFVARASQLPAGDPFDPECRVGPLINEATARRLEEWISEAATAGAHVACGGHRSGNVIPATVILGADDSMRVVCEEVFGPLVTINAYATFEDAISAANRTPWGLKAGVFTGSLSRAFQAARELEYGTVNVNGPSRSRIDHEPSGGTKQSGWGREGPRYAIEDMTYLKMISVRPGHQL